MFTDVQYPTDITTGQKTHLDLNLVIQALHRIALDPTNQANDAARGQGYDYIAQA